jgi:hypothetical protein
MDRKNQEPGLDPTQARDLGRSIPTRVYPAVGELFDYVRDQVKKATLNQQHPVIGTNPFDRRLPMAITGGIDAQQRYELGCRLYELAARLDDRKRFRTAAAQFYQAIQLSKITRAPFPQAELGLGKALLAADQLDIALEVLSDDRSRRLARGSGILSWHRTHKAARISGRHFRIREIPGAHPR